MPRGLVRLHHTGDAHFLTFSCDGRRPYLTTPSARELLENALERTRRRYGFLIYAYVVMPEHVHLLVTEPEKGTIADLMKALKLSVALRRTERPFWEERYHDFNVFTERKRVEKLKYIHRNPVARGLVERPEDWVWSSFEHYATGVSRGVVIESEWTARLQQRSSIGPGSENPDPGHPAAEALSEVSR
jgi:putative transposase